MASTFVAGLCKICWWHWNLESQSCRRVIVCYLPPVMGTRKLHWCIISFPLGLRAILGNNSLGIISIFSKFESRPFHCLFWNRGSVYYGSLTSSMWIRMVWFILRTVGVSGFLMMVMKMKMKKKMMMTMTPAFLVQYGCREVSSSLQYFQLSPPIFVLLESILR